MTVRYAASVAVATACVFGSVAPTMRLVSAQESSHTTIVEARSATELRDWDRRLNGMIRTGELRLRDMRNDTLMKGRRHERSDQYYRGVRVFGGDVARQSRDGGLTESAFGTIYEGIDIDPSPAIDEEQARTALADRGLDTSGAPELVILPLGGSTPDVVRYALAWRFRVKTRNDSRQVFIDAVTGATLLDFSDRKTQTAVGRAQGVLGDTKKISVRSTTGQFVTADELRPPAIQTYDMRGNPDRVDDVLLGRVTLATADLASDSDNNWSDGAVDDAHVYAGYTYDYYFKRFGRHGLNNADIHVQNMVHPVRRGDFFRFVDDFPEYFVNAFYDGDGVMVYGEGLPAGLTLGGQTWDFLAGALDVVAHELTHGVTEYTSNLIYRNESGALNESFSDMMGTSAEFFFQPPGNGPLKADYLLGEDVVRPGGLRSMENPGTYGDPDHYSKRYLGTEDSGGVHTNSGIPNHAFYLAIEGGTNRTSGLTVQGVGGGNRDQIEKVFYRAFTQLLPSAATFAVARAATIQAARDLYGSGSPAERAVTQAWTAVGVN
ncbi:MAG: bacillolysin [Acidobacteriota bacterium]